MLFNSIDFALFFPAVFIIYWFILRKWHKAQNWLVVIASYVFYGWWDWRFLTLVLFSTVVDYLVGLAMVKTVNKARRKSLLLLSLLTNLGLLGIFKYFNFFLDNLKQAYTLFGQEMNMTSLEIILPVGISFYTFQTLSYSIDIYRRKIEPTKDFIAFAGFVSFFPQLVAGPIERATNLLPQFLKSRQFDYAKAVDGLRQMLWGLFKKVVIADNCAEYANLIFNNSDQYSGTTLALGAVFFAFQIYADFSGYSDIAIGVARLLGFELHQNFAFPYFSRDIAEFWRRWHISLSSWFRDYVYIPLGGSQGTRNQTIRNIFVIFIVSGFWHGANWTFIFWGLLNAIYFIPLFVLQKNRVNMQVVAGGKWIPQGTELTKIVLTFSLTTFAWIFFRAENIGHAFDYISAMLNGFFNATSYQETWHMLNYTISKKIPLLIALFIVMEWMGRDGKYALEMIHLRWGRKSRWMAYYLIILAIIVYSGKEQDFIYFQF